MWMFQNGFEMVSCGHVKGGLAKTLNLEMFQQCHGWLLSSCIPSSRGEFASTREIYIAPRNELHMQVQFNLVTYEA